MQFIKAFGASLATFCLVLVAWSTCFAADGAAPAADPLWVQVLIGLFITAGGTVLSGLAWVLKRLFDWLAEKTKWTFMSRIDDLALVIVTDIYNRTVKKLKTDQGGKLTEAQKATYWLEAKNSLRQWITPKGIARAVAILGGNDAADKYLGAVVNKAVTVAKNAGKAARNTSPQSASGSA